LEISLVTQFISEAIHQQFNAESYAWTSPGRLLVHGSACAWTVTGLKSQSMKVRRKSRTTKSKQGNGLLLLLLPYK
jgi:hypothetical protein